VSESSCVCTVARSRSRLAGLWVQMPIMGWGCGCQMLRSGLLCAGSGAHKQHATQRMAAVKLQCALATVMGLILSF
jgi:hypothetical protein